MLLQLFLCVSLVFAAPSSQEILSLPGWNEKLPTKQYSGLIDVGVPPSGQGRMLMHYWFIESEVKSTHRRRKKKKLKASPFFAERSQERSRSFVDERWTRSKLHLR